MSFCRRCGREIEWITTAAGKAIPFDPEPVFVIEGEGRDTFTDDTGAPIVGRVASPEEESPELPVAFVPHWATCRNDSNPRGWINSNIRQWLKSQDAAGKG